MPQVVLRHPDFPGMPVVLNLATGEKVDYSFKARGFVIDPDTTALEAEEERAETVAKLAAEQAEKLAAVPFVAEFDDPPEGVPAAPTPAPAPDPLDLGQSAGNAPDGTEQGDSSPDNQKES